MNSLIRQLPENTMGRDFVLGDLHGCYALLDKLLKYVTFDMRVDRLFSVGDLADRGPDSLRCLQLLAEPWFYTVKGNHEQMLIDFFKPYRYPTHSIHADEYEQHVELLMDNGGRWISEYFQDPTELMHCLDRMENLPLIYVVGEESQRFHVIHAELVKSSSRYQYSFWLDSDIDGWLMTGVVPDAVQSRLLWGRSLMSNDYDLPINPQLSRTFCGHTIISRPRQTGSHIAIDTGAFISLKGDERHGLTLFAVNEQCYYWASYAQKEVFLFSC